MRNRMRKQIISRPTVKLFLSLNDGYKSRKYMTLLMTLTSQWELSREKEMT